ncbi:hypothetical protein O7635_05860 [Asanoa sp. WMMD1127]|uniref:hypothetical protein n=1 Tax=Asanoa sp. WMMD1127 TaxID=3016107 RepID=UPI0024166EFA|nr:hypothetical protein [Asanoa sp. WMMD1127]MDG4821379.1 hypothetical protein [Asanoa sp. WMMD1127]
MVKGKLRRLKRQGRGGFARGVFGPIGDLLRPGHDLTNLGLPGNRLRHPGATPFPVRSLRGQSIRSLRRQRPSNWREVPTRENEGFIWLDENGVERLRFMRPTGEPPTANKWSRQANGYLRWQSSQSTPGDGPEGKLFLDTDGNLVPWNHPEVQDLTHLMYEGPWP